jgi:hypothetical protein
MSKSANRPDAAFRGRDAAARAMRRARPRRARTRPDERMDDDARDASASSDEESDGGLCVDDLLISSDDDDDDDAHERESVAAVNARGDVVRAMSSTKAMSMSSSMAETSEEAVRVLVRRVSKRAEAEMDSEASSSTREDEDAREDDENEDGLALAAANEARMLASKGGGDVSTTRAARDEARRATRALAERVGRSQTMSAGCAVELKNVEGVTNAMMDTVDAGRAMCCALGPNRSSAVGTEGGFIFVERCMKGETTVSCLKSANNFAGITAMPGVTSLCFDDRGEWLLVGHDDGGLTLWDIKRNPTILKSVIGVHRTPVIALVMLSKPHANGAVDVISSEEGGLVIHHTFSPLGMGVIRVKSTSLGERAFVISAQSLPRIASVSISDVSANENGIVSTTHGETASGDSNVADAAGIIALCTMNAILIMRLNPRAEVIEKISRPPNVATHVLPVVCWSPRWAEEVQITDGIEECKLVAVWGTSVYSLAVDIHTVKTAPGNHDQVRRESKTSRIICSWSVDSEMSASAMATMWLSNELICILTNRNKMFIYTPSGQLIDRVPTSEPPIVREITRGAVGPESTSERLQYWYGAVAVRGVHFAILSPSRLRRGKYLGWFERMNSRKMAKDWFGAFETLLQVHGGELSLWPCLSKKYTDTEITRKKVVKAFVDNIPTFLEEFLKLRGVDVDEPAYLEVLVNVIFGILCSFDALKEVYSSAVFDAFLRSKCKSAFLQGMVPYVLSDKLRSLPAEVMQALVDHYASIDAANVIEKCVLHMDVESLDLNQVARLCKHHNMYSALAHVFTKALNDFVTPLEAMFQGSLAPTFGDKARVRQLLLFVLDTIRGKRFPVSDGELSHEVVTKFRMDAMKFLFEPIDMSTFTAGASDTTGRNVDAWTRALASMEVDKHLPPLRLLYLLLMEPKATATVMMEILKDWDASKSEVLSVECHEEDKMSSQIVAEASVFAAGVFGSLGLASSRTTLLTFTASVVGTGRASVAQETEQELLEALARTQSKHDSLVREDAMVSIIARRIDEDITLHDEERILKLVQDAQFSQAEAVIYIASGDHISALKALVGDSHRSNAAVHYVDVLFGKSSPGTLQSEKSNAGPAVARAAPLDVDAARSFRAELLHIMPQLASISPDACARIAISYFPCEQTEVLNALAEEPVLQFQYLKQVLEAVHVDADDAHVMSLADLIEATKSVVTSEMNELYCRLMCQFEPQDVLKYLQSEIARNLDRSLCLKYCREFNVMDATAYLLEMEGEHEEALSIHLYNYSTGVRAMAQLFTTIGTEWTKTAPAESLMKGFIIEVNEALCVAIDLCRRVSSAVENSEEMWWSCLDSVIRSLLELSDGPFERVRAVLDEHLEDVLRVMFGRVDNAQLLEMIVTRYNGQDILGLRKLLSRAFGNCSLEREFLKAEESSVQDEVDKKVEEGQQMRRRAQRGTRRTLANFV